MTIPPDMTTELKRFDDACTAALDLFIKNLAAKPPPRTIYHYTRKAGLKGILKSGTLWLTDIWGQNDPSELKHGFCHAVKILNRHAAEGSAELKKFAQGFERLLMGNRVHNAGHFFISCLSVAGDDLGQWRAYAEDGRGYALAFDTSLLEDAFKQASKPHDQTLPNHIQ